MSSAEIDMKSLSPAAQACVAKMRDKKVSEACIRTFLHQHQQISSGATGFIADADIQPVESLASLEGLTVQSQNAILESTVVLKLNGGLGTGMGLHDAKTLLEVKDGKTFLDFTALQVQHLRQHYSSRLRFMLMNSFNTSDSTKAFIKEHYPWLHEVFDTEVELMQNEVPKILHDTLAPASWPQDPKLEWSPPGHGDLYTALYGSGKLQDLLRHGYRYMFVSNGDNLGATLDSRILAYMDDHDIDFLMEVCHRTESDKKGGHLAQQTTLVKGEKGAEDAERTKLLLRESAQCRDEDKDSFQDIHKYSFFNTNNLWIKLPALMDIMEEYGGMLPLPVIRNEKTVDPSDASSPKVYQLETAMGAAIQLFEHAAALVVPRSRFAPVKSCADLLALRSDAYTVTEDSCLSLAEECHGRPPVVDLDSTYYKMIKGFEKLVRHGVPSMVECKRLNVKGLVEFGAHDVLKGVVKIENPDTAHPYQIPSDMILENITSTPEATVKNDPEAK